PASAELLVRAAQHGHALQTIVAGLGRLLQRYGARELEAAILEVLKLEGPAPHPNSVLLALEKRRERRRQPPLAACRTEVCGWFSDGFLRFAAAVDAQSGFVGVRLSLLDRRWSWIDGAPGRAALNRRGRGRTIA